MINKFLSVILIISVLFGVFNCSGRRSLSKENPYPQASAKIILRDGSSKEGIILKRDRDTLLYVDSKSNKKESIGYDSIIDITESDNIYDFSGKVIPASEIRKNKKWTNTLLYGVGGLTLGTAVGFGAALVVLNVDSDQALAANITLGAFAVAGTIYFGYLGSNRDYDNSVFKVRKIHYKSEKKLREEEKQKIEYLKSEKEKLLKQIKKKDNK